MRKITKNIRTKMELAFQRFDFKKTHDAMINMNWYWGANNRVPEIEEMQSVAMELLENCYQDEDCTYCATGGFEASYRRKEFFLKFIVEDSSSYIDGENEEDKENADLSQKANKKRIRTNAIEKLEI